MKYHHFDMLPERAFQRDPSGKIKPQGGGGGTKAPSSQTVTQTTIPEYARPYAESMLGQAQALTDINQNPYQPYTGQRFASFSPMQAQAFQNISGQQVAPQITDASNIAYTAAGQGLAAQPVAAGLQQAAMGYGQAGAGYGQAASSLGIAGAEGARQAALNAQARAGMFGNLAYGAGQTGMQYGSLGAQYGGMGLGYGQQAADFGALGAQQAGMTAQDIRNQAQQLSGTAMGLGIGGQNLAQQTAAQAGAGAMGYAGMGAGYGAQGATLAEQAQRAAERQADIYGQMGAGFGAQGAQQAAQAQRAAEQAAARYGQMGAGFGAAATGMAPAAQQYGGTAAQMGQAGMGYGAQGAGIGGLGVQAAQQGFGAQQAYQQMATSPEAQQAYMSPYMQNVVGVQQREAVRQADIARQAEQARAVGQGAFGGSRSAIVEAERQKNLASQLGDIQAMGSQQAFQQAQQAQQFGAGLGIQGLQAGYQGLQTGLQGTAQGIQGAQTGIQGQQAGLAGLQQAGQLYGLGITGAQAGLSGVGQQLAAGQLGLAGTAQGMQGAGLGLQGTGQRLAAGQLGLAGTAQGMQGAGMGLQGIGQLLASGQLGATGTQLGLQGAGLGMQGLGQQLAAGQLGLAGTAQGMQGALGGVQGVQAGIQGAQAGMQGAQLGISGAQAGLQGVGQQIAGGQLGLQGAQTGIQGQQAGIQGAQAGLQGVGQAVGAGQYGLQGAQTALQGAGQLGQLGQTQFGQEMSITDALQKYGALQQQQQQQGLDFAYQQFLAQQQYPYQQLSYMSDLMRGIPSSQSSMYQYQQQPALAPQLLGAGLSAYGAFARSKEGGRVGDAKRYAEGGMVTPDAMGAMDVRAFSSRLKRLTDSQLAAYARGAKDAVTLSSVNTEIQRRARSRQPMTDIPEMTTAAGIAKRAEAASIGQPMVTMAGGGIVALQQGGAPYDDPSMVDPFASLSGWTPEAMAADEARVKAAQEKSAREEAQQRLRFLQQAAPDTATKYAEENAAILNPVSPAAPVSTAPKTPSVETTKKTPEEAPPAPKAAPSQYGPVAPGGIGMPRNAQEALRQQYERIGKFGEVGEKEQSLLTDMQKRLESRMERAEKGKDTAIYDAILMGGLAMMGGRTLAEGIAKAAQTGGATFMAGSKEANKAINEAEAAELAFRKYQIELDKGREEKAERQFDNYVKHAIELEKIGAMYASKAAGSAGGIDADTKRWNMASLRLNGDKVIQSIVKKLDDPLTSPEEKIALSKQFNDRGRAIFESAKAGDLFNPISAPEAAPTKPKEQSWFGRLFGSDSQPSKGATPPPPAGFVVQ